MTLSETHPAFPSGTWEGFYTYHMGMLASRHPMQFSLNFRDGTISGSGSDEVGTFSWYGEYRLQEMYCRMVKRYTTHEVVYSGQVDENGIWGTWTIHNWTGGFHIWPRHKGAEWQAAGSKAAVRGGSG